MLDLTSIAGGKFWQVVAAVCAVAALVAIVAAWYANATADTLREELGGLRRDLKACQGTIATYKTLVEEQNKAVETLKVESERRRTESVAALNAMRAEIVKRAAIASARTDALTKATPSNADCKAALTLIRKELGK